MSQGPVRVTASVRRWQLDWPLALEMAKQGKSASEIAHALKRLLKQVNWKFRLEKVAVARAPKPQNYKPYRPSTNYVAPSAKISPEQEADREARYLASMLRSQTQEFFGDPPPGFSAFDRNRQREGRAP